MTSNVNYYFLANVAKTYVSKYDLKEFCKNSFPTIFDTDVGHQKSFITVITVPKIIVVRNRLERGKI